jgi:hypothetical protein
VPALSLDTGVRSVTGASVGERDLSHTGVECSAPKRVEGWPKVALSSLGEDCTPHGAGTALLESSSAS